MNSWWLKKLNDKEMTRRINARYVYTLTAAEPISDGFVEYDEDGKTVKNPYKLLPSVSTYLDIPQEEIDKIDAKDDDTVSNGGAALAAYGKLQFSDTQMSQALEKALLCYCELDTLAMVFIWEYFNDCCKNS